MAYIVDANYLKRGHLYGVRYTDGSGNAWTDAMFDQAIAAAQDYAARDLQIPIGDTSYATYTDERHDLEARNNGYEIYTHFRPIREVTACHLRYGTAEVMEMPLSWLDVQDAEAGQIQIVPRSGAVAQVSTAVWAFFSRPALHRQLALTYTAGYKVSDASPLLKDYVAVCASLAMLAFAGDLIIGAGIASQSMSIDGLSQAVSTTASAMYGGYSARAGDLQKKLEEYKRALLATETGFDFAAC